MKVRISVVEIYVPRELGHVHVKLTLLHDRSDVDVHIVPLLEMATEMLSKWPVLPDGAEIALSITRILEYLIERDIDRIEALQLTRGVQP